MNNLVRVRVVVFTDMMAYHTDDHVDVNRYKDKHDAFESVFETLRNQYPKGFHIVTADAFFTQPFMARI